MKIQTTPFLEAVKTVSRLTGRRHYLPILASVLLKAKDNRLTMTATDLDHWWERSVPCEGSLEPCCVPASRLAVQHTTDSLAITRNNGWLQIEGSGTFRLGTLPPDEFCPQPKDAKLKRIGVNCADLADAIGQVEWSAGEDEVKFILQSVHVHLTPKATKVEATNGKALAQVVLPAISAEAEFIAPINAIPHFLVALREDGAVLSVGETQIRVESEAGDLWFKQVEGLYLNTQQVIPQDPKEIGTIKAADWLPALQHCRMLLGDERPAVTMDFQTDKATLACQNESGEQFTGSIAGNFQPCKMICASDHWIAALKAFKDADISLGLQDKCVQMKAGNLLILTMQFPS